MDGKVEKPVIAVLLLMAGSLLYVLLLGEFSAPRLWQQRQIVQEKEKELHEFERGNLKLAAEVADLKKGSEAIEQRAREDLGMIKQGEVFYQLIQQ